VANGFSVLWDVMLSAFSTILPGAISPLRGAIAKIERIVITQVEEKSR
jgi:hypothetical protein